MNESHQVSQAFQKLLSSNGDKRKEWSRTQQQLPRPNSPLKIHRWSCVSHKKKKNGLDLTAKSNISMCLNKDMTNPKNLCLI